MAIINGDNADNVLMRHQPVAIPSTARRRRRACSAWPATISSMAARATTNLLGQAGNDLLNGGAGADAMTGGAGNDI